MSGRITIATLALAWVGLHAPVMAGEPGSVDVRPKPMEFLAPGTVIGETPPQGWTDLVLVATPRIGVGDVNDVPSMAASYSSLFRFAILARVRGERDGDATHFTLDKVAIGTSTDIGGHQVVVNAENTLDADLGFIGRGVLSENDRILKEDMRQVARTPTMLVLDANAIVLRDGKHRAMILRHVILASPATGKLSTFVWLLGSDGGSGYALADKGLQKLPLGLKEDRVLSVDGRKFTLGIPSKDAFALAKIPQGTSLGFSEALKAVAATRQFTKESARKLEAELQARYAPVADRSVGVAKVRR